MTDTPEPEPDSEPEPDTRAHPDNNVHPTAEPYDLCDVLATEQNRRKHKQPKAQEPPRPPATPNPAPSLAPSTPSPAASRQPHRSRYQSRSLTSPLWCTPTFGCPFKHTLLSSSRHANNKSKLHRSACHARPRMPALERCTQIYLHLRIRLRESHEEDSPHRRLPPRVVPRRREDSVVSLASQ
jgi:hypothetical protein